MSYDYAKLKGRIKEKCNTQDNFAEAIGIGRVSLSKRLNNQIEFTQDEMFKACEVLDIKKDELPEYFFCAKV